MRIRAPHAAEDAASGCAPRPLQPYLPFEAQGYVERTSRVPGVEVLYAFRTGEAGARTKAVPDACADAVFGIGASDVEILVGGTVLQACDWTFDPSRSWVGCRFSLARAILPEGVCARDVIAHDLRLGGDAYGPELEERLYRATGPAERIAALEGALAARIGREGAHGRADAAPARLERYVRQRIYATDGAITVSMLARESGVSERYLRRVFTDIHGITPKQFCCFVRFQRLLGLIGDGEAADGRSVKDMALACGYYDQAHLVHEFKRFAGITPERYRRLMGGARARRAVRAETAGGPSPDAAGI